MENENKNKVESNNTKTKRVGRTTFGITMILLGVSIIAQMLTKMDVFRYILMLWPLIFVAFGIEILVCSNSKNSNTKFDGVAIVLTFIILFFGSIFSLVNLGINKVLYDEEFKQSIIQSNLSDNQFYTFDGNNVKLENYTNNKINLIVQDSKNTDITRVNVKVKYNYENVGNNLIVALINTHSINNFVDIYRSNNSLLINDMPEYIEDLTLVVSIADKNNIVTEGNFEIK